MAVGNGGYRPNFDTGAIVAPKVGDIFLDFADRQTKQFNTGLDRELAEAKEKKEQTRWDITNKRAEDLAKRQEDEYQRGIAKETATNEALKATLDPKAYQNEKMLGEQNVIAQTLAGMAPEDRAVAEAQIKANYNPNISREQWLGTALGSVNADQSKVLSTKKNVYDIAANTPGTPEYEAKVKADKELYSWKQELEHKNRMAEIDAQTAGRKQEANEAKMDDHEAYATYAKAIGVNVDPKDTTSTLKLKIGEKEKFNKADLDKKLEAQKKEDEYKKDSYDTLGVEGIMKNLRIPMETSWVGDNDSTRVRAFLADPHIKNAMRSGKVTSKDLNDLLQTQVKAGDSVENALENVGNALTGRSMDF